MAAAAFLDGSTVKLRQNWAHRRSMSCTPRRYDIVRPAGRNRISGPVCAAILRAHPQLSVQEPANSTSGDEDEECRHAAVVQKADYDLDHESHQERQYRAQQNGSRD